MNRAAILFCLIVAGSVCGALVKLHSAPAGHPAKEFYIKSSAIVRPNAKE